MSDLENIARQVSELNSTMEQIRMHLKNIRYAVESEARDGDIQPKPNENVDEVSKSKDYDENLPGQAASYLTQNGYDLSKLTIYREDGELIINPKEGREAGDEWQDWTSTYFGEDKPGWISWGTFEREDGSEGYYPKEYRLPIENFEAVFE